MIKRIIREEKKKIHIIKRSFMKKIQKTELKKLKKKRTSSDETILRAISTGSENSDRFIFLLQELQVFFR